MSLIYAERLIELAIRVGTDDLIKDPTLIDLMFFTDKKLNQGADLTPDGQTEKVYEQLPMDYFQQRLRDLPRKPSETGLHDIFGNSIPGLPDIKTYLASANVRITHGFPRDSQDLPAIAITLGNEDEDVKYFGVTKDTLQGENKRYKIIGSDFGSQYNIHILTPNYDELIIWYHIIRRALLVYRIHIQAYGLRDQSMSWLDPEPAPEYLQSGLFVYQRTCVLSCQKEEDVPVEEKGFNEFEFGVPGVPDSDGTVIPNPEGPPPEPIDPRLLLEGQ